MSAEARRQSPRGDRRLRAVVLVGLLLLVPSTGLRLACIGKACGPASPDMGPLPFCSLPSPVRELIEAGFYGVRSPDVLAVSGEVDISGGSGAWRERTAVPWPSTTPDTGVPIVFSGKGARRGIALPAGTGLAQIAPTIAEAVGLRRPFPNVRSGEAVQGVATGARPRLVVEIALRGIGARDLEAAESAWPNLSQLIQAGAGTIRGTTGSVPVDPAATLTTVGTGGLPSEHGITGALLRNSSGKVVHAWGPGSPLAVIATLAEDLDEQLNQRPLIGLVRTGAVDSGIVGGTWYPRHDQDLIAKAVGPSESARQAAELLGRGFGRDRVPDLLAIVMQGRPAELDRALGRIIVDARRAAGGSVLFVIAGTGSAAAGDSVDGKAVTASVEATIGPVVMASMPGGLFLDQPALAAEGMTGVAVRDALLGAEDTEGRALVVDAFQAYAVGFGRYC